MNRKQLTVIIVLGLVLGGLGLYITRRNAATYQSSGPAMGRKLLPDLPVNDVAQVTIKQSTNELNLVKADDSWQVRERYNYPANFGEIGDTLRKMWELKVVQTEQVGPSQLHRLELLEPGAGTNSGTLVELKDKSGKVLKSVLLGKKHMKKSEGASPSPYGGAEGFADGRYVLVLKGPKEVAVVSDALSDVEAKADRWISKDFFKIEKIKTVSVTHTNATNSWKLTREMENGEVKLADLKEGEQLDTGKSSAAGNALSYPSFNDVVAPDTKPEETGLDHPVVARLETFEGFTYTVKIGKKTGEDNYYMTLGVAGDFPRERTPGQDEKPEDKEKLDNEFKEKLGKHEEKLKQEKSYEKWTYLVTKWTVDPLLKERKELLVEKKEEPKPAGQSTTSTPPGSPLPSVPGLEVPSKPAEKSPEPAESTKPENR